MGTVVLLLIGKERAKAHCESEMGLGLMYIFSRYLFCRVEDDFFSSLIFSMNGQCFFSIRMFFFSDLQIIEDHNV